MSISRRTVLKTISAGLLTSLAGCSKVSTAPVNESDKEELYTDDTGFDSSELNMGVTENLIKGDDMFIENIDIKPNESATGFELRLTFKAKSETEIDEYYVHLDGPFTENREPPYGETVVIPIANEEFDTDIALVGLKNRSIDSIIKCRVIYQETTV